MLYLRWEEALRVEAAAASLRDRLIVRLCMYGGLRAHEAADARIEDVDPAGGLIYVPHGHNNGPRYVAIDRETLRLLAVYVGPRKKGPLLVREDRAPLTRWIVYYAIRKAGENAGIRKSKPVGPVMLRHTFATTWLKRKGNIRLLQKQMGHTKLESTAYYLDWMPEEVKMEYDQLFEESKELTQIAAT
jgi:integrase